MDSEPRDLDLWMAETLNNWAELGELAPEKSLFLRSRIGELAGQERKNRICRTIYRIVATIIAYLWLLFTSSPVAAAACPGSLIQSNTAISMNIIILITMGLGWGFIYWTRSQDINHIEVYYG